MITRFPIVVALWIALALPCVGCAQETDRAETFDEVWSAINDNYFDPSFGGRNWKQIGQRYRDRAITAQTDSIFYVHLNEMLFELGVSHVAVIPKDHPEWIGAPSLFSDGGIGAEARLIADEMVLTVVRPGSRAEAAGLRPGFVLQTINGKTLDDLTEKALAPPRPPLDPRVLVTQSVLEELYGPAGTSLALEVTDGEGAKREKTIVRERRPGRTTFMEGLPPTFVEFEFGWLQEDIAYLRFNSFHPDLLDQILAALGRLDHAAGLVMDLRGNPGGAFGVRRAIAEHLVATRRLFMKYERRDGTEEVYLDPADRVYTGPVAILTDCMSSSSSEEFAGSMQAIGRAAVVGDRTPGIVLVADIVPLRSGDTLVYPSAQSVTPDGRVLEGRGVIPDIEIHRTVESLLAGRDIQLEAAIRYIRDTVVD